MKRHRRGTVEERPFVDAASVASQVRLAAPVARRIATEGLTSGDARQGFDDISEASALMYWLGLLAGDQVERLTDDNLKVMASWDDIEGLAAMTFALGIAVGLRFRPDAFEDGGGR